MYAETATSEPKKKTKSRKGCLTCKKKRLKCDETKPTCRNCAEKKLACGGYATNFKWKSFNDSGSGSSPSVTMTISTPMNRVKSTNSSQSDHTIKSEPMDRSRSASSLYVKGSNDESSFSSSTSSNQAASTLQNDNDLKRHLELASLSVTGKSIQDIKAENELISQGINPNTYNKESRETFEIPTSKKLKRSYSYETEETSSENSMYYTSKANGSKRPRSKSTTSNLDIKNYRNDLNMSASNGLASLAEAAVDEIRGRSPSLDSQGNPSLYLQQLNQQQNILGQPRSQNQDQFIDPNSQSPNIPQRQLQQQNGVLMNNKKYSMNQQSPISTSLSPFSPGFSDFMNHTIPNTSTNKGSVNLQMKQGGRKSPSLSSVASSQNNEHQISTLRDKGQFSAFNAGEQGLIDLNLTPSLSALINYAFTNEKDIDENKFGTMFDIPLSPLNLNKSNNEFEANGNGTILDNNKISLVESPQVNGNAPVIHTPGNEFSRATTPALSNDLDQLLSKTAETDQILHLYSHYTCSIMSIKNGPNENPWRTLIIPLATTYPCLFNSIAAMTLFHLAGSSSVNSQALRAKGYVYMKKCILELASGLTKMNDKSSPNSTETKELPSDIALTTCINLAVCECWDRHTSSGIAHLKGAKSMIQKVLNVLRHQQSIDVQNYKDTKRLELLGASDDDSSIKSGSSFNISKNSDFRKKLVTVDEIEWERIIHENGEKFDDSTVNIDQMAITIPKNLQFLFNAWIYFEVLAQMTTDFNQDEKGIDLVATITTISETTQKRKSEKSKKIRSINNSTGGSISDMHSDLSPSEKSESSSSSHDVNFASKGSKNNFNFFDHFETFNFSNDHVDPLLGCAQSLFSIMGKVAGLVSKIRRLRWEEVEKTDEKRHKKSSGVRYSTNFRNSLSTITLATKLRQSLIDWKPTISSTMFDSKGHSGVSGSGGSGSGGMNGLDESASPTWDMSSCIATAEAYRYATLLYLHQAVPEVPSLSSHQLAEKVFILLASIPLTSNIFVVHIFPLLVSSCEAEEGEEREWCLIRWGELAEKMWIGNIDRAIEVVKEVWRRKDEELSKRKRLRDEERVSFNVSGGDKDAAKLSNINEQLSGLMAAISNQDGGKGDDLRGGINSRLHWSSVMKEWGWEVLLA